MLEAAAPPEPKSFATNPTLPPRKNQPLTPQPLRASASLAWREILRFFRQPNRIVGSIGTPVLFWLLFGTGLKNSFSLSAAGQGGISFLEYYFVGSLVLILIGYGLPIAYKSLNGGRWRWPFGELGSKFIPGGLALSIVAGAYLAESIRAGIEAIPKGQMEAARSLGMPHGLAMRKVILPQAFRIIIPPLTNELTALLKDTSLIAILGVQVGGREILQYARTLTNARANTTPLVVGGLAYLVITIPLLRLVALLERRAKGGGGSSVRLRLRPRHGGSKA